MVSVAEDRVLAHPLLLNMNVQVLCEDCSTPIYMTVHLTGLGGKWSFSHDHCFQLLVVNIHEGLSRFTDEEAERRHAL